MADEALREKQEQEKLAKARDQAKRDEMAGWIRRTFSDPEFRALDSKDKISIMEQADPEFQSIPDMADKARVVQSYLYQVPKGMPSTGSAWRDFAESFVGAAMQPVYYGGELVRRGEQKLFGKTGEKLEEMGVPKGMVEFMGLEGHPLERPETQYFLRPTESFAGKAGAIAEPIVELALAPELKATKVPKLLKSGQALMRAGKPVLRETLPSFLARSATEGVKLGVQAGLHGDKPVPGAILGASMPMAGWMVNKIVAPSLAGSARWLYNRALNPTTKITKGETAEVVPELLERHFWRATFPRLKDAAEENLANAEQGVGQAEAAAIRRSQRTYTTTGYYRVSRTPPPRPGPATINVPPAGGAGAAAGAPGAAPAAGGAAAIPGGAGPLAQAGGEEMLGPEAAARARRSQAAWERRRQFSGRGAPPPPRGAPGAGAGTAGAGGRAGYGVYTATPGLVDVKPVFDRLQAELAKTHVSGVFPSPQAGTLYNQLRDQLNRLAMVAQTGWTPQGRYGWYMTLPQAIKFRRILDKPLGQAGVFYNDPAWASLFHVQEIAANSLRGVIKDNFPELVKPYQEYHLWKTGIHIMEQTERRKIGQIGLLHVLATAGPLVGRGIMGGDIASELGEVVLANAAMSLVSSPGMQTMTGVGFQRIADALESRNVTAFLQAAGTVVRPRQDQEEDYNVPPPVPGRGGEPAPRAAAPAGGRGMPVVEAARGPVAAEAGRGAPAVTPKTPGTAAAARPKPSPFAQSATPPPGTTWEYWGLKPPVGNQPPQPTGEFRRGLRLERRAPQAAPPRAARPPAGRAGGRGRPDFTAQYQQVGRATGVPAGLLHAIAQLESSGNPDAVGGSGEIGLMQFMPATAKALKVDPRDPEQSIRGAATLLRHLMQKYRGDIASVLAAYNEGETAFDRRRRRGQALPAITQRYVRNGLALLGRGGQSLAGAR